MGYIEIFIKFPYHILIFQGILLITITLAIIVKNK